MNEVSTVRVLLAVLVVTVALLSGVVAAALPTGGPADHWPAHLRNGGKAFVLTITAAVAVLGVAGPISGG